MHLWHHRCEPPNPMDTLTDRLNTLLNSSGPGYTLSLCPSQEYFITAPLHFAAPNQEISTAGYPTDSTRAMLVVAGPVVNGTGHTTAVDGTCANCDGVKLRNVQINGTRLGGPAVFGGANIEMGGPNADQRIEYVRSFDPRGWSCLHLAQGKLNCTGAIVQNNYIGPAGSSAYRQWADGISVACRNSVVRNNMINNPTDGGIVLFGAPGTRVEDNTIWVETQTLLGGINMVDVSPFGGDYSGVVVTNNTVVGGFATQPAEGSETKGSNDDDVIIKVGIAIGPRIWFGSHYGNNVSTGGIVQGNQLTGAFSYGIAMNSAANFTVENNVLIGNTSFIGARGPNCTTRNPFPSPAAFVMDLNSVQDSMTQMSFGSITYNDSLVSCVMPPTGSDLWPVGNSIPPPSDHFDLGHIFQPLGDWQDVSVDAGTLSLAVFAVVLITWFLWRWPVKRPNLDKLHPRYPVDYVRRKIFPRYMRLPSDPPALQAS